jgi:hypothetical protein
MFMNIITQFIDKLSYLIFGVPIFKVIEQARETKNACKQIDDLAKRKKLSEAIKLAQKTSSCWSANPSGLEKWLRNQFLGNKLIRLKECQQEWQRQLDRAKKLIQSARHLVKTVEKNPCDQEGLSNLNKALSLYQQAEQIVYDVTLKQKIGDLEITIKKYTVFQSKLSDAEQLADKLYFRQAIAVINDAKNLIPAPELEIKIASYEASVKKEEEYEDNLKKIRSLVTSNQHDAAKALLEKSLVNFNRSDGRHLLDRLNNIIEFQEKLSQAIIEEKQNKLDTAKKTYLAAVRQAVSVSQNFDQSAIYFRLATICVKTHKYDEGLSYLTGLHCEKSSYLRGFIYAKQKQWQQAGREWRKIQNPEIRSQLGILKDLIERDKLKSIQAIESDLKNRNHQSALEKSQLFLQKFGSDPIIEQNLTQHIKPWLTAERWNAKGSADLVELSEKEWLETPNISTLHNLTVALYEQVDQNPDVPISLFSKLIGLWFTLLVNLEHNPKLRNIVWMDSANINLNHLRDKLIKVMEQLMEKFKQKSPTQFDLLRDSFRLELMVLNALQETHSQGMKFNQMSILPGCYYQYSHLFPKLNFSHDQVSALYSDWGYAVAACLDNHIARAIEMKPKSAPQSPAETYGFTFVAYHEGRYHLQQFDWRQSVEALNSIQSSIRSNSEWRESLNQLCVAQRQKIDDFHEHLEFAQFWYDLSQSQDSRSYLAEYKAEAIREQLIQKQISDDLALTKLSELKKIDPHNPVVLDLYEKVKNHQEVEQFEKLIKAGDIEKLVNFARRSSNEKIRFAAAELFIEMALNAAEKQSLDFDAIRQLGRWAYEIEPHEPAFQEVYKALRLPY